MMGFPSCVILFVPFLVNSFGMQIILLANYLPPQCNAINLPLFTSQMYQTTVKEAAVRKAGCYIVSHSPCLGRKVSLECIKVGLYRL